MQGPALDSVPAREVIVGDLEDLEKMARARDAELVIGNSHAVDSALRLNVPIFRAGFPLFDLIGGYQRTNVGYRGARQLLFDLANLLEENKRCAIPVHRSIYSQKRDPNVSEHDNDRVDTHAAAGL